eukprot:TRINITY_DN7379_c0_g2_i1.p1 TRINITY_DN7379_c0_g2~~TRINITY_DN7379_c0_g2_i1.p1  ORF type:complete len:329 (+),score=46.33 TRINITY_DN7379_c0_g2_i1:377-1363(+)
MESHLPTVADFVSSKCPNLASLLAYGMHQPVPVAHVSKALDSLAVPMAGSPNSVHMADAARVPAMSDLGQEDRSVSSPENYTVPVHEPVSIHRSPEGCYPLIDLSSGAERLVPTIHDDDSYSSAENSASARQSPFSGPGASSVLHERYLDPLGSRNHGVTFTFGFLPKPKTKPMNRNFLNNGYDSDDDTARAVPASVGAAKASAKRRARTHRPAHAYDLSDDDMEAMSEDYVPTDMAEEPSAKKAAPSPPRQRKQKQCACCKTTSTPLWRDVRPNLPLCNACGIRFKKYGKICETCHYVPCKSERDSKACNRCGDKLPPACKPKVVRK